MAAASLAATYGIRDRIDLRGSADFALTDNLFARISGVSKQQRGYIARRDYGCDFPNSGDSASALEHQRLRRRLRQRRESRGRARRVALGAERRSGSQCRAGLHARRSQSDGHRARRRRHARARQRAAQSERRRRASKLSLVAVRRARMARITTTPNYYNPPVTSAQGVALGESRPEAESVLRRLGRVARR